MIRKCAQRAAMTVAFTGVAAAALAVQPPDPNNAQSVLQWTERENISAVTTNPSGSWQPLGADTAFLMMGGILAPKDAAGIAKVGVRMEMFAPSDVGAGTPALSVAQLFDADCNRNTIKMTSQAVYRERNLAGLIGESAADEAAEPVAGHPLATTVQEACAARRGAPAAPVAAAEPSVNFQDRSAVMAWVQRNVQPSTLGMTWDEAGTLPLGILYYGIDSRNSESRTNRRVRVRLELFDPVQTQSGTLLSEVSDFDLNCLRNEARKVRVTAYAQHNLAGPGVVTNNTPEAYQPAQQVSPINSLAEEICREISASPSFRNPGE